MRSAAVAPSCTCTAVSLIEHTQVQCWLSYRQGCVKGMFLPVFMLVHMPYLCATHTWGVGLPGLLAFLPCLCSNTQGVDLPRSRLARLHVGSDAVCMPNATHTHTCKLRTWHQYASWPGRWLPCHIHIRQITHAYICTLSHGVSCRAYMKSS